MCATYDPSSLFMFGETLMQTDKRESEGFFCHLGFSLLVGSPWFIHLTCLGVCELWIVYIIHYLAIYCKYCDMEKSSETRKGLIIKHWNNQICASDKLWIGDILC